jgi:hypothetical protein
MAQDAEGGCSDKMHNNSKVTTVGPSNQDNCSERTLEDNGSRFPTMVEAEGMFYSTACGRGANW